jgi:hypothetical protein
VRRERTWEPKKGIQKGSDDDARKLAAFLYLALEMTFFIQEILETEVGLVHVVSCVGRDLLVSASGGIGVSIESFQAGEESTGANMNRSWIIGRGGLGSEFTEGVDDTVWRLHHLMGSCRQKDKTKTGAERDEVTGPEPDRELTAKLSSIRSHLKSACSSPLTK